EARLNDVTGRDFIKSFSDTSVTKQSGTLTIGRLESSPASFTFGAVVNQGNPEAQTLNIDTGDTTTSWTIETDVETTEEWINPSQTSGTCTMEVNVNINTSGLAARTYEGTIRVTAEPEVQEL